MSGKCNVLYVQTDTRKRNAAVERHSDIYEQTILYTNRHEREELGPRSNDRENLCVDMSPSSKRLERDIFI
jgi:hypothetical protein